MYPSKFVTKSVDRWTRNENSEKKVSIPFILVLKMCGHVDKNLSFYFMFSFFYASFTIMTKSVDRWTSNENS
jgi:hypothetical protein